MNKGITEIAPNNAASYVLDAPGHQSSTVAFSRRAAALRRQASGHATPAEVADATTPLQTLVKRRRPKAPPALVTQ